MRRSYLLDTREVGVLSTLVEHLNQQFGLLPLQVNDKYSNTYVANSFSSFILSM